MEVKGVDDCQAVNENGLACKKKLYHAQNGEYWEHPGGHLFASDVTWKSLNEDHYDAEAILSGRPAGHHSPDDCDGSHPYCAWRFPVNSATIVSE